MKKSLIFWLAAVTCAALFLVGCESPTNGEAGAAGAPGVAVFTGTPSVQAVKAAVDSGAPIYLDSVTITGAGTLDFGTANVTVFGTLATSNNSDALYIVAGSSVKLADEASIAPGADDYFIGTQDHVDAAEGAANVVKSVSTSELATLTSGVVGIENLTLSNGLVIPSGLKVFVYGTLDVKGTADAPSGGYGNGGISAIGTVLITADNTAALSVSTNVDVSNATISYGGTSTVAITLPATLSSPTFKVTGNGGVLKVGSATTTVNAHVEAGNGFVEFAGAVTKATITGGGNVRFKDGSTATAFTGSGSVFTNTITASIIEFTNGFSTSQYAAVSLSGAVYIPDTKAITFGHADGTLTLTKGSAIYAGTPGGTGTAKVLEATEEALLTPTATAALTAAVSTTTLTLGTEALTLTSGMLAVAAGATLVGDDLTVKGTLVADGTVKTSDGTNSVAITKATVVGDETTGAVFAAAGTLTLADGDTLVLADEGTITTAGTGSVVVGSTDATKYTLKGGSFTAGGSASETVSFIGATAGSSIKGSVATATLTLGASAELAIAAAATTGAKLDAVTVDVSANGSITIAEAGKLLLAENGGIKTGGDSSAIDDSTYVTGNSTGIVAGSSSASITGGDGTNNTVNKNDTFASSSGVITITGA